MGKVQFKVMIDKKLNNEFREFLVKKYGQAEGFLSSEVEQALRSWMAQKPVEQKPVELEELQLKEQIKELESLKASLSELKGKLSVLDKLNKLDKLDKLDALEKELANLKQLAAEKSREIELTPHFIDSFVKHTTDCYACRKTLEAALNKYYKVVDTDKLRKSSKSKKKSLL